MAWHYRHVGKYLEFARKAFEHTKNGGTVQTDWAGRPLDAEGWKRDFCRALHRRINAKVDRPGGRKWVSDHQTHLRRDQQRLHEILRSRLRVYQFETQEVSSRFGHLLASRDDW